MYVNTETITNHWIESAKKNVNVAEDMYKLGHYNWCLFMWHLAIEKLLKAIITAKDTEVPYVHDLRKLSEVAAIDYDILTVSPAEFDEISLFNLEARYEDYKNEFYKKATKEYTDRWVPKCKDIFNKLIKQL